MWRAHPAPIMGAPCRAGVLWGVLGGPAGLSQGAQPCLSTHLPSPDLRIPLMWKDTEYFRNKGGEWGGAW